MKNYRPSRLFPVILLSIGFIAFNNQGLANETSAMPNSNVISLTLSKKEVIAGSTLEGTVTLAIPAQLGGSVVPLVSDNRAVIVPESVTVPFGATKATFTIRTEAVEKEISATIKAGSEATQKSAVLSVKPLVISSLALSVNQVVGGTSVRGTVSLNGPAPANGFNVSLSSSLSATARVPSSITIAAGKISAVFDITTTKVTNADSQITITASPTDRTTQKITANLTVTLPLIPEILSMSTNPLATATSSHSISFLFDRPLTSTHAIQLISSNPSVIPSSPNLNISIPQANIQIFQTPNQVASDTPVTLTATSGNSSKSVTITVRPFRLESFTFASSNVTGGTSVTGTISFNLPRNNQTLVTLTSSDNSVSIPSAINFLGGQSTATFEAFTQTVTSQRTTTITATMPSDLGGGTKTTSLIISPVAIASVSLATQRCDLHRNCPTTIDGTITLNGPAPTEGVNVALTSDRTNAATVPSTALISSGQTTRSFTVSIQPNANDGLVRITATAGSGSSGFTNLELESTFLEVESISLNTTQAQGGTPITGTVTVRQFVEMGSSQTTVTPTSFQTRVNLATNVNNSGSFQPTSLVVPSGQASGQFTFTPSAVASQATIQVRANADFQVMGNLASGVLRSASLTVTPATIQAINLSQTNVQGGQQVTGTIQMSGPVPFSNSVSLTSSDTSAATVSGLSFSSGNPVGTFAVNTSASVTSPTTVTITATFAGQTMTTQLTVIRPSALSSVSFPASRIFSGLQTNIRVELDGPAPSGGSIVFVNSSIPQTIGLVNTPFTIPAGQNFVTIQRIPSSGGNSQQLSVRASYQNQSISVPVTVEPLFLDVCSSSAGQAVVGGTPINCSLTIATSGMVAPEGGIQFSVQNPNPTVLSAPATFTFPAGQNSATIQIPTQPVTQNTNVQITFSIPGSGFSRTFTITPP